MSLGSTYLYTYIWKLLRNLSKPPLTEWIKNPKKKYNCFGKLFLGLKIATILVILIKCRMEEYMAHEIGNQLSVYL